MHITLFSSNGPVAKRLIKQSLNRGFTLTAFGRNIEDWIDEDNRNERLIAIKGYVFDKKNLASALRDADTAIVLFEGMNDSADKSRSLGIKHIAEAMQQCHVKRIIMVCSSGILNEDEDTFVMDTPDFPEKKLSVAQEELKMFEYIQSTNLLWTCFCPDSIIDADETGLFTTNLNLMNQPTHSPVNAGDLALCILNEVENNAFIHQRVEIHNT